MPFRKLRDFLWGYALPVWRYGKLSKLRHCVLLLDPEAQGHSPKIKAFSSEGHSRFRTSGGKAAKKGFVLPVAIFAILSCSPYAFAQFRPTSREVSETPGTPANQLPLSGRSGQTGSVTATQTPTPGATTSINTINPT
ncbi:MAG: hypothetical protein ACREA2_15085, partial [Blastocatellia bacterium]